jgi:hypothetical protein
MRFKRLNKNTIELSDRRGFTTTMSLDGFNKVEASVDTDVEEFLIDAHIATLNHYQVLFKRKNLDFLTRQFLSIGRFRWNITKIYKKVKMFTKTNRITVLFKKLLEAESENE